MVHFSSLWLDAQQKSVGDSEQVGSAVALGAGPSSAQSSSPSTILTDSSALGQLVVTPGIAAILLLWTKLSTSSPSQLLAEGSVPNRSLKNRLFA